MGLPGSTPGDTNPKLYSNLVGSIFPDSLLKVGVANIDTNGQHSPEDFGDYWFVDQINVNVKIKLSINDFKLLNEQNTKYSFNKQNINWSYNIGSSQGTYAALAYFYECQNFYKIGIVRVDDGGSYNFTRRSDAIGNYMFESSVSGSVTNGQIKVYCQNKALLYMYDYGNGTGDRVESEILLYKDNYEITGFN